MPYLRPHPQSEGLVQDLRYQLHLGGASRPDHITLVSQELRERLKPYVIANTRLTASASAHYLNHYLDHYLTT